MASWQQGSNKGLYQTIKAFCIILNLFLVDYGSAFDQHRCFIIQHFHEAALDIEMFAGIPVDDYFHFTFVKALTSGACLSNTSKRPSIPGKRIPSTSPL